MQKICIVIPCYNEEDRLPVTQFIESYDKSSYSYYFINDGSKDQTKDVITELIKGREDRFFLLDIKKNKGKSEAVRLGILAASNKNQYSIIGYLDADLATPLSEVETITNRISDKIFFAFGSRVKRVGTNIKRKWYRHIFGRIFATIASKILNTGVYDTQCGAKFFKVDIVNVVFTEPFKTKWIFDLEIFLRILNIYNINEIAIEVPIQEWKDVSGSKLKFFDLFRILKELFLLRKYKQNR
jgi:dolichyl-phosphate beta-glucosyltransferase